MTGEMLLGFVIGVLSEGLVSFLIIMFSEAKIASTQTVWTQEYKKIRKVYNDIVWKLPEDHRIQLSIDEIRKIIQNKTDLDYEVDQQSTNDYVYFLRIYWYIDRFDEIILGSHFHCFLYHRILAYCRCHYDFRIFFQLGCVECFQHSETVQMRHDQIQYQDIGTLAVIL